MISIKTQVRRLKYFSVFIESLGEIGLPKKILEKKIIKWSLSNCSELQRYISPTGGISKARIKIDSYSFHNYCQAANKLKIIREEIDYVEPTKIGRELNTLKEITGLKEETQNVFELDILEKIFFMYLILNHDADIFILMQQMVHENPRNTIDFFIKKFQGHHKERLKEKINIAGTAEKTRIIDAFNRVIQWRSPKRYCEDIVPPRLNWMLDLGLVSKDLYQSDKRFELSYLGKKLYDKLPAVNTHHSMKDINDDWINHSLFSFLGEFLNDTDVKSWPDSSQKEQEDLMMESFFYARKYFSILDVPRLSVLQTYLFISMYLLIQKKIKIEFNDISNWIGFERIIKTQKIGLRTAARPEESYIVFSDA